MDLSQIITKPLITEKGSWLGAENKYCFRVFLGANKAQIKQAVEKYFPVKVINVNMLKVRGKIKRSGKLRRAAKQADWKKAIVQLKAGDKIDIFEAPAKTENKPARPAAKPVTDKKGEKQ